MTASHSKFITDADTAVKEIKKSLTLGSKDPKCLYQMVILDYEMTTEWNGKDLISKIKELYDEHSIEKLPIFVCHSIDSNKDTALINGFDHYLEKPCLSLAFVNMLKKYNIIK